ncbi:hypothetical protein [Fusobacterium gastrosuis]|uniref:hypothetical protein n=1 Tax=Fusobacterium gastrosuis TaxID=1755100 RepID=UPI002978D4D8|nr:hypothetical protein [Fusobacteriaceae bacterium]MDY5713830.1 hypothetical protein [Fusobacterium gastrosuis]
MKKIFIFALGLFLLVGCESKEEKIAREKQKKINSIIKLVEILVEKDNVYSALEQIENFEKNNPNLKDKKEIKEIKDKILSKIEDIDKKNRVWELKESINEFKENTGYYLRKENLEEDILCLIYKNQNGYLVSYVLKNNIADKKSLEIKFKVDETPSFTMPSIVSLHNESTIIVVNSDELIEKMQNGVEKIMVSIQLENGENLVGTFLLGDFKEKLEFIE